MLAAYFMTSPINTYFDHVYVLNLHRRNDRMALCAKRLAFIDLAYDRFGGVDGQVMQAVWKSVPGGAFENSSYLACSLSHLAIYADALSRGYSRILVVEDDCRVHRLAQSLFSLNIRTVPTDWAELLYLGFIPLSQDRTRWDYSELSGRFISSSVCIASNLWGLYAYGIAAPLMRELIDHYNSSLPCELDRYFVEQIQPRQKSFALCPQLFAAEDGPSDNSGRFETGMLDRSIDPRFAAHADYI